MFFLGLYVSGSVAHNVCPQADIDEPVNTPTNALSVMSVCCRTLMNVKFLRYIEPGAFHGMKHLRTM